MAVNYIYRQWVTCETDYVYTAAVSSTTNPRLKYPDTNGNWLDFPPGQGALVWAFINGTGTSGTDAFYKIGYGGSTTSRMRLLLHGNTPAASNRVAMALDGSGYPYFYTGHGNNYTVKIHVKRI